MPDKPITLDEAASEFVNNFTDRPYSSQHKMWADIFRAGAEWKSQQTKPTGLNFDGLQDKIAELVRERLDELEIHKWWDYGDFEEIRNKDTTAFNIAEDIFSMLISETEETKPVEDKTEKKYSYKITEHESYIIAYKVDTFEERTIAICDNAEKADFICKALNLCSNNPELLETQKPVSEDEGE